MKPAPLVLGIVVGALLAGLVLPFAVDDDGDRRGVAAVGTTGAPVGGSTPAAVSDAAPGDEPAEPVGDAREAASRSTRTSGGGGAAGGAAEPGSAVRAGTDVGLTADTVRLGFVLLDLGGSGSMGFDFGLDPAQQEAALRAAIDEVNERGGLAGRRIEPTFATFNVLDAFTPRGDSGRTACLKLTEDDKVFAVVGYLFPADQLCVTREHGTPLLSDAANNLDSTFAAAEGRLLSVYPRAGRIMTNFVAGLDEAGFLAGKKVGIVGELNADPQSEVANALAAAVKAAGHQVARITMLSGDISQGASQMPVEVSQQRRAGAQVILFLTHPLYIQQFAQQAESQGWRPRYGFSDFANGTADAANDMPDSLDGALGVAGAYPGAGTKDIAGWDEPKAAVDCRANYERRTGQKLPGRGDNKYSIALIACDDLRILVELAGAAGDVFNRASFVGAADRVGAIEGLGRIPGGSYGPGKRDLADYRRLSVYDASCDCFHPRGPFRRMT